MRDYEFNSSGDENLLIIFDNGGELFFDLTEDMYEFSSIIKGIYEEMENEIEGKKEKLSNSWEDFGDWTINYSAQIHEEKLEIRISFGCNGIAFEWRPESLKAIKLFCFELTEFIDDEI